MKKRERILNGPIGKTILFLAVPIILANLLQTVYNLTDTFWVGRLGADSVAAVSISFPIIFFLMSLVMGLGSAGMVFIAQYYGKGDKDKANYYATQSFFWMTFFAFILAVLGAIFSKQLIQLFNPTELVFSQAVSYLTISFYGIVFMFIYMIFMSILRGVGEVKVPLIIVLGTTLLNFILDPLFVYGLWFIPASGVSGVAWATFFTQGLAALAGVCILVKGNYGVKLKRKYFNFDFGALKQILKIGLPSSIERSLSSVGMIVFTLIVSSFGTIALASYGIGSRLLMLVLIPSMGLAMAVMTFVAQNIGAKKLDRAEAGSRFGLFWGFISLSLVGVLLYFSAEVVVSFFIPNDFAVIKMATEFARIVAYGFGFIALQVVVGGVYKSAGRTMISLSFGIVNLILLVGLSLFFMGYGFGETGAWVAYLLSYVIGGLIAFVVYLTGSWKKKALIE